MRRRPGVSPTLTVDQVRQALPADSIILEYFQIQDRMVVLLLSREQLEIVPLASLSETAIVVQSLQFQLSKLRLGTEYARTVRRHFAEDGPDASGQTLQDTDRTGSEVDQGGASGHRTSWSFAHLPFHALFNGQRYLIDEFTISYAPSASTYALCQARSAPRTRQL